MYIMQRNVATHALQISTASKPLA